MKDEIQKILRIITSEQKLNAQRYVELKNAIEGLATKDDLNHIFDSLSQDHSALSIDHQKIKKRVNAHERRIKKVEAKVLLS